MLPAVAPRDLEFDPALAIGHVEAVRDGSGVKHHNPPR